jgi:hypothetical protein
MSTKFVSKNSNLMVVLRSGIEGSRALGTASKPGLYARFQGGIIDVKNDEMTELLRAHPGLGTDFIEINEAEVDPFEYNRDEIEPTHVISEMKYGHVEKTQGTPKKIKLSPEMKSLIEKQALAMLPSLLKSNPGILKDMLQKLVAEEDKTAKVEDEVVEDVTTDETTPVKRGPGRPAVKK